MQWHDELHERWRHAAWSRSMQRRPNWVWIATIASALLVVLVPLVLLTLTVLVVATTVFTVLSLVAAGLAWLRRLFAGPRPTSPSPPSAGDDGRRNVRIVQR